MDKIRGQPELGALFPEQVEILIQVIENVGIVIDEVSDWNNREWAPDVLKNLKEKELIRGDLTYKDIKKFLRKHLEYENNFDEYLSLVY
jgi:hypothetical protein